MCNRPTKYPRKKTGPTWDVDYRRLKDCLQTEEAAEAFDGRFSEIEKRLEILEQKVGRLEHVFQKATDLINASLSFVDRDDL